MEGHRFLTSSSSCFAIRAACTSSFAALAAITAACTSSSLPQLSGMGGAAGELNYETTQAWRLAIFFLFFLIISIVAEKARRRGPCCHSASPRYYLYRESL